MKNEIPYELLSQYFAGECSAEEERQVQEWIAVDPARKQTIEQLRELWLEVGKHRQAVDIDALWRNIDVRTTMQERSLSDSLAANHKQALSTFNYIFRIAAVIVLLVGIPYVVYKFAQPEAPLVTEIPMREVSTSNGERAQFRFSDGTRIWLNAASTIRFAAPFTGGKREVFLEGEAYFEVARNERMPFIVHTQTAAVEVLGTEFNVHARGEERQVDVVVAGGSVLLRRRDTDSADKIVLTKGLQSSITGEGVITPARPVNVDLFTSWVKGRLVFDRTPIKLALRELERWYGLQCSLEGNGSLESLHLTASFKDEPLEEVLHTIAVTTNLTVGKNGNEVLFSSSKNR